MSKISGIRDLDREILGKVEDKELLNVCLIDKYTWNNVCDDAFLRRRLSKYPEIEQYKREWETWKQFFGRATFYIDKMKEEYGYDYGFGNFATQYNLLNQYLNKNDKNRLLSYASGAGQLGLVIWSLKIGANIHCGNDFALRLASAYGNLEVVKYLVKHGADINAHDYDSVLDLACRHDNLSVVKYLVECGAIITDNSLTVATLNGHKEVANFLKSIKSDIK